MLRVIGEIQPTYVVGENVRGLLNWSRGLVFDQVQADLEAKGYEIAPLLLPACAVDAPHRRDRIWFVAISRQTINQKRKLFKEGQQFGGRREAWSEFTSSSREGIITDTKKERLSKRNGKSAQHETHSAAQRYDGFSQWENFPTVAPIRIRNDGVSPGLVRRIIQGAGNAIVPRLAFEIFKSIASVATQE